MMKENDAADLLIANEGLGISAWIGGGWGIDALICSQTRPHNDIDVYIERKNAGVFTDMLASKGYYEVETEYTNKVHTVWQNQSGCMVDLHLFDFDGTETLLYDNDPYPSEVLNGKGITQLSVQKLQNNL